MRGRSEGLNRGLVCPLGVMPCALSCLAQPLCRCAVGQGGDDDARARALCGTHRLIKEGGNDEVKEKCAAAIWALTEDCAPNKATVAKLGGIEPLVTLLVSCKTDTSLELSVGALGSLAAKHGDNREAIAKQLVGRMTSRAAMISVPNGAVRVLTAVSMLSLQHSTNQTAFAKAGAVPPLIMWLSGGMDAKALNPAAQVEASHALLCVVSNNQPVQGVVAKQEDGIAAVIRLLKLGGRVQEYAACALWHLGSKRSVGADIATAGGLTPLVAMLGCDDEHAQDLAATVINRLAHAQSSVALALAQAGGIPPLAHLIRHGSAVAQQQAADAIAEVSLIAATRDAVAAAGSIQALVQLLSSRVMGTSEIAARALANVARDSDTAEDGGIAAGQLDSVAGGAEPTPPSPTIVTSAPPSPPRGPSPPQVRAGQAGGASDASPGGVASSEEGEGADRGPGVDGEAVRSVVESPGAKRRQLIAEAGGVAQLVMMLMMPRIGGVPEKMADLVNRVLGLESSLSDADDSRISPVVGPKRSETAVIGAAEQAAATLSDVAYGDLAMQAAIMDQNGVPPLLLLMRNGSSHAQENACRCVSATYPSPAPPKQARNACLRACMPHLLEWHTACMPPDVAMPSDLSARCGPQIWNLCEDIDHQGVIVDCGAIVDRSARRRYNAHPLWPLCYSVPS